VPGDDWSADSPAGAAAVVRGADCETFAVFVADACGSVTAIGHDISLRRMEQAGITQTTTASVSAELACDYPRHSRMMRGG